MKVTKSILREMIEAEINTLNESITDESLRDAFELFGSLVGVGPDGNIVSDIESEDPEVREAALQNARDAFSRVAETVTTEDWAGPRKGMLSRIYQVAQEKGLIDNTNDVPDEIVASWSGTTTSDDFKRSADDDFMDWDTPSAGETAVAQEGGETVLSAESVEMLTAISTQGGRTLRRGSKGTRVRLLQEALIVRLGTDSEAIANLGEPDGDFGGKTEAAVLVLQRKYEIEADGAVGPNTAASLLADEGATGSRPQRRRQQQPETETTPEEVAEVVPPPMQSEGVSGAIGYESIEGENNVALSAWKINFDATSRGTWVSLTDDDNRARKYNDKWYLSVDAGNEWFEQNDLRYLDNDDNKFFDFLHNAGSDYYTKNTQTIRASGMERNPDSGFSRFNTRYGSKMIAIFVEGTEARLVHFDADYKETDEPRQSGWFNNELTFAKQSASASAGRETNAQVSDDAPTADSLNPLPGRSADAGPNESFTYDRFSKLAGLLKG